MLHICSNLGKVSTRRQYAPRLPIGDRREQILDAAIQIIVRDGYGKVSIDSIAREAGITRPVVYSAYDGLGPLLIALLDRQQARAVTQLAGVIPEELPQGDPEGVAVQAIEAWMQHVVADPVTWRPILTQRHSMPDVVWSRIDGTRELIRLQIAELIRLGFPDDGLDIEVGSHMLLVVFEHFGALLLEEPRRYEPARLAESIRTLFDGWRAVTDRSGRRAHKDRRPSVPERLKDGVRAARS